MRTITVSLKELENFVVDFSVRADELAGVNGALTIGVGGAASMAPSATSICCQNPPNERLLRDASSSLRIFAWSAAFLLGPVPVVKTMEFFSLSTLET